MTPKSSYFFSFGYILWNISNTETIWHKIGKFPNINMTLKKLIGGNDWTVFTQVFKRFGESCGLWLVLTGMQLKLWFCEASSKWLQLHQYDYEHPATDPAGHQIKAICRPGLISNPSFLWWMSKLPNLYLRLIHFSCFFEVQNIVQEECLKSEHDV